MSIFFPLMFRTHLSAVGRPFKRFVDLVVGLVGTTPLLRGSFGGRFRDHLANRELGETCVKKQYSFTPDYVNEKYSSSSAKPDVPDWMLVPFGGWLGGY